MTPTKIGDKFINRIGLNGYVQTLIAAAENTSGIIIRTCYGYSGSLYTGAQAPNPNALANSPLFFQSQSALLSQPYEILVPAGQGIYWAPYNSDARLYITYDVQQ